MTSEGPALFMGRHLYANRFARIFASPSFIFCRGEFAVATETLHKALENGFYQAYLAGHFEKVGYSEAVS